MRQRARGQRSKDGLVEPYPEEAALRVNAGGRALVVVLVGASALLAYAWWAQHPAGLMSVDDSGYSMTALTDWRALVEHGLKGLVKAFMTNGAPNAPLVPLLAAPFTATDPMSTATVLAQVPFVWLLIVSSHSIFGRVASPKAALVGTVVTVFLPGVLTYARLLHFAVPLTAVLTAALAALLASERLTNWRWALVFGFMSGLALLTRTVALALVPGLVMASVVLAARYSSPRVWVRNLALALLAAAAVAVPWYAVNSSVLSAYLVGNGYSDSSSFYVPGPPWLMRLAQIVGQDILIPLTLVGVGIIGVALVRWVLRTNGAAATETAGFGGQRAATVTIAVAIAWYFVALSSSRNVGTAFTLPLAPLLVALVLSFSSRLGRRQATVAGAITLAVVALNVVAAAVPLGRLGVGEVAGVGDIGIIDGRSASDAQIAQALGQPGATISDPAAVGASLTKANCAIAARAEAGAILMVRPDALLGGILLCAQGTYRTQAFMYSTGCSSEDSACVAGVIATYGFPTIVTGESRAGYPGYLPEESILPYLAGYRMSMEIDFAPGEVVHVWVPLSP